MASHNVSFTGVVGTPQTGVVYKPYSGTNNYGYWIYEGGNFVQVTIQHGDPVTTVDITSYLNTVSSPAENDTINPTGYTFVKLDGTKFIIYKTAKWKCAAAN